MLMNYQGAKLHANYAVFGVYNKTLGVISAISDNSKALRMRIDLKTRKFFLTK